MPDIHPQAQPFFLEAGTTACILVHGFTTSPSEMRQLGENLHQEGFSVKAPLLPGHGSSPADLNRTSWRDWYGAVQDELVSLQNRYERLYLIGLSMGGLLALKAASEMQGVHGVVTINSPIYLKGSLVPFAPVIKFFRPYIPKRIDDNYREMKRRERFAYDDIPVKAFLSMKELIKLVVKNLKKVTGPVLIFQSETDESIEEKSALIIRNHCGSEDKTLIWLKQSTHVATMGPECDLIAREIVNFITRHGNRGGNDNEQRRSCEAAQKTPEEQKPV